MPKYSLIIMLIFLLIVLAWSRKDCFDKMTWWMEAFPVILALPVLIFTGRRFPLTHLLYILLFLHGIILLIGAKYTYARVPIGFYVQKWFNMNRNCYDRLGHWFQGFTPAILAREILLRRSPLTCGRRLFFLVTCVCLAFSAFYELVEWWTSVALGSKADEFLGTQGDIWDSQWDMMLALIGSIVAQLTLAKIHDAQLAKLRSIKQA